MKEIKQVLGMAASPTSTAPYGDVKKLLSAVPIRTNYFLTAHPIEICERLGKDFFPTYTSLENHITILDLEYGDMVMLDDDQKEILLRLMTHLEASGKMTF